MCTFGLTGCRVKPQRLRGRWSFTRQLENSKRAHLRAPTLQTPPKFHEKTPQRKQKEQKWGRECKNAQHFGPPILRDPRGPTLQRPIFSGFGLTLWAPPRHTHPDPNRQVRRCQVFSWSVRTPLERWQMRRFNLCCVSSTKRDSAVWSDPSCRPRVRT